MEHTQNIPFVEHYRMLPWELLLIVHLFIQFSSRWMNGGVSFLLCLKLLLVHFQHEANYLMALYIEERKILGWGTRLEQFSHSLSPNCSCTNHILLQPRIITHSQPGGNPKWLSKYHSLTWHNTCHYIEGHYITAGVKSHKQVITMSWKCRVKQYKS